MDSTPMLPSPKKAMEQYRFSEQSASRAYEKYWLQMFANAGLKFTYDSQDGAYTATEGDYIIEISVYPRAWGGAKLFVFHVQGPVGQPRWRYMQTRVKIQSLTGFNRFISRLRRKGFDQTPPLPFSLSH